MRRLVACPLSLRRPGSHLPRNPATTSRPLGVSRKCTYSRNSRIANNRYTQAASILPAGMRLSGDYEVWSPHVQEVGYNSGPKGNGSFPTSRIWTELSYID